MLTEFREKKLIWVYRYSDRIIAFLNDQLCWECSSHDRAQQFEKWAEAQQNKGLNVVRGN